MKPGNFLTELKRRNVYKVAIAYGVAGWLLIQIATQVFPFFEVPNWVVRLTVLLVLLGFPIALLVAWAFELTPQGLQRTEVADRLPRSSSPHRRWVYVALMAGLLSAGLFFIGRFVAFPTQNQSQPVAVVEKSIAVLPFANLSDDQENSYFTNGIQDEILTRLSKIADLKVISRSSTQQYKSTPENLPEIARQLGVAHILEGSVQKSGDAVRVNVQLIRAADDSHLWADTFDRKLIDIFSVETEVAKTIAEKLQAKLTGREAQVITAQPTTNSAAHDAYLRGLADRLKPSFTTAATATEAQKNLREAVRLDPEFAVAWALLAEVDAIGYLTTNLDPTLALQEEARHAAETAYTLQPNLGEALLAQGYYYYACLKDYDHAVSYFAKARQLLPNSSQIPEALAYVARRRGQWAQSETYFGDVESLDPRNVYALGQDGLSKLMQRRFPDALRKFQQVLEITPNDTDTITNLALVAQARDDLPRAAALLAPLRPIAADSLLRTQLYQGILERHPEAAIPQLQEMLARPDSTQAAANAELRYLLGWAQELEADHAAAQETWRQARRELEALLPLQPDNYRLLGNLALTQLALGDKAQALSLAERGLKVKPLQTDAVHGGIPIEYLARVAAQAGEPDRALASLEKLLSIPGEGIFNLPLTPALLRLDPMFDPLRSDPRFQKLAEGKP